MSVALAQLNKNQNISNPRQADTRFVSLGNTQTDFPPLSTLYIDHDPEFGGLPAVSSIQVWPRYAELVYVVNGTTGFAGAQGGSAAAPVANAVSRTSVSANLAKDSLVLKANPARKFFTVDNHSTKTVYLGYGSDVVSVAAGKYDISLPSNSTTFREAQWQGEVHIITDPAVNGFVNVSEYS